MTLILDLDGVVLKKNAAMNYQFSALFQKEGISPAQFWKSYRAMRSAEMFSPKRLWRYLPKEFAPRRRQIEKRIFQFFSKAHRYVYADADRLVRWAHGHAIDVCIYTHGQRHVQGIKVRAIQGRYPFLRSVITVDPAKQNDVRRCLTVDSSWIWIDDSPVVAKAVPRSLRRHFLYLRRSKTIPIVPGVRSIRTLSQALPLIAKNLPVVKL